MAVNFCVNLIEKISKERLDGPTLLLRFGEASTRLDRIVTSVQYCLVPSSTSAFVSYAWIEIEYFLENGVAQAIMPDTIPSGSSWWTNLWQKTRSSSSRSRSESYKSRRQPENTLSYH